MSEKWTDKLPGLLDGYEEAAPEGLWDAVQGEIKPKRSIVPVFWWAGAAAAAAVAAIAVFLWKPSADIPLPEAVTPVPQTAQTIIADIPEPVLKPEKAAQPATAVKPEKAVETATEVVPEAIPEAAVLPEPVAEPVREPVPEPEAKPESVGTVQPEPVVTEQTEPAAEAKPVIRVPLKKEKYRREAAVTFRSGNYLAQGGSIVTNGYGVPGNPGMVNYPTKADGNPITVQMLSRNRESTTTGNHSQGIRLFLGLSYGLSPRWSIESGLSYKVLHSDYNTVSGLSSSNVTRSMTYIGIPVNAQFNALELGGFRLYFTAGPMVETCTRVSVDTRTFVGETLASEQKDYPHTKDIRLSLNAGIGAQVRLSSRGALFVQPGFSWQLCGSGSMESFYTAHPFSWDLSLGWRFLF